MRTMFLILCPSRSPTLSDNQIKCVWVKEGVGSTCEAQCPQNITYPYQSTAITSNKQVKCVWVGQGWYNLPVELDTHRTLRVLTKVLEGFLDLVIGQLQVLIYGDQRGLDPVLIVVATEVGDGVCPQTILGDLLLYQTQNLNFWEVPKVTYIYKSREARLHKHVSTNLKEA